MPNTNSNFQWNQTNKAEIRKQREKTFFLCEFSILYCRSRICERREFLLVIENCIQFCSNVGNWKLLRCTSFDSVMTWYDNKNSLSKDSFIFPILRKHFLFTTQHKMHNIYCASLFVVLVFCIVWVCCD